MLLLEFAADGSCATRARSRKQSESRFRVLTRQWGLVEEEAEARQKQRRTEAERGGLGHQVLLLPEPFRGRQLGKLLLPVPCVVQNTNNHGSNETPVLIQI